MWYRCGLKHCKGIQENLVAIVDRSATSGAGTWDFTGLQSTFATTGTPPEARFYTINGDVRSHEVSSFGPFTFGFSYNVILPVHLLPSTTNWKMPMAN